IFGMAAVILLLAAPPPAPAGNKKGDKAQAAPTNLVWPLPPDKPRVKFLTAYASNYDIEPRKKRSWVDKMVGNGDPNVVEMFEKAAGVATDSKGRVYVVSSQRAMLYILDKEKHQVTRVNGDRGLQFRTPLGVVVDSKDNFYVADAQMHMVFKFGPDAHLHGTGREPPPATGGGFPLAPGAGLQPGYAATGEQGWQARRQEGRIQLPHRGRGSAGRQRRG